MSFFHANQREALNQSLAEVNGQINVSFEFFPPRTSDAMTTLNPELSKRNVLINSVMGLCGESGEAIDIVKKWMAQ